MATVVTRKLSDFIPQMDRRLLLELLPGAAFLIGHAMGGLLWAATFAVVATAMAVAIRWRWDGNVPWLAVSTLVLALILTAFGLILNDETFVLVRPTVGALAFAGILTAGAFLRPSLLERTLGYTLQIEPKAWPVLHGAWIAVTLASAGANEIARRTLTTDQWAIYNVLSDPVLFGLIWLATWLVAYCYWLEDAQA